MHAHAHMCTMCTPWRLHRVIQAATTASEGSHCVLPMRGNCRRRQAAAAPATGATSSGQLVQTHRYLRLCARYCVPVRLYVCLYVCELTKQTANANCTFSFHISAAAIEAPYIKNQPPKKLGAHVCAACVCVCMCMSVLACE